jgi:hypothetical protein
VYAAACPLLVEGSGKLFEDIALGLRRHSVAFIMLRIEFVEFD